MLTMATSSLPESGDPPPISAPPALQRLLPRGLGERVRTVRSDLRTLWSVLAGTPPSPLVERPTGRRRRAFGLSSRTVEVVGVVRETPDAVSLQLAQPGGEPIAHVAGQFMTLLVPYDGQTLRRAYSISSPPGAEPLTVTIKRVEGGRASNFLNDHAHTGMRLQVLGPSGSFVLEPDPESARQLVLIGGGSGITPLISILEQALVKEPGTRVTLIYGNRGEADIIFKARLDALAASHPYRVKLHHVLEAPPEGWSGTRGRLDGPTLEAELDAARVFADESLAPEFFICGPGPMMEAAREVLLQRGVPTARIREERFSSPGSVRHVDSSSAQPVVFKSAGGAREVVVEAGQTVLEAGVAAGQPVPFSCAMGGCGACKCKVVSGHVAMEEPNCLTASERDAGWVLTCVGRPTEPTVLEVPA